MLDIKHRDTSQSTVYNTSRWRKFRAVFLFNNPFCVFIMDDGKPCNAWSNTADHIVPISQGGAIWDEGNLQSLCQSHHSLKTINENRNADGTYG